MKTLIKGGRVVTAVDDYRADVLVDGETVALIGSNLDAMADKVVDAGGKYVLPGGIDVHTHLDLPFGGTFASDDFQTGHIAAAFGGTTTHIDFAVQGKGQTLHQGLDTWHAKAKGKACIDYGFHMIVTDLNDAILDELDQVVSEGVTSIKLFLAYPGVFMVDDGTLFRTLQRCAKNGGLVMVHAENGYAIDHLIKQALSRGETAPRHHALTRPAVLEGEATGRAITLAELAGAPLYVVHVTCADSAGKIKDARARGSAIYGETCPQYLYLDVSAYDEANFGGAKYVMSPPLREKWNQDVLWSAIEKDHLQIVSTDHCPFVMKAGFAGLPAQKELGRDDFSKIPNGAPGIETRMDLMHDGAVKGRYSLNRFVEMCCTAPAKMFGMFPKKGTVAVGSDADLVIYDPTVRHEFSHATLHQRVDYTPFEGIEVQGRTETVLLRGKTIIEGGKYLGSPGEGQFLKRARFTGPR